MPPAGAPLTGAPPAYARITGALPADAPFSGAPRPRARKAELLAPAGDLERLKVALLYGADAVYAGYGGLSLRGRAASFGPGELARGAEYAHGLGKKIYVAVNAFAGCADLPQIEACASRLREIGADAAIVSDLGVMDIMRQAAPELPIHVSTQANCTNSRAAAVLRRLGAKRVVLARELALGDVAAIRRHAPPDLELELFVHGAMCMAYSGRCMISKYLAGRDANRGDCAQPCRWRYSLVEEKRPGRCLPVSEDADGTYLFNSDDLCLIEHLPEAIGSGADALKIEGRAKGAYYVAAVASAYRAAIDHYYAWLRDRGLAPGAGAPAPASASARSASLPSAAAGHLGPTGYFGATGHLGNAPNAAAPIYSAPPEFLAEVSKASHRRFTTGFAIDAGKTAIRENDKTAACFQEYEMIGIVLPSDDAAPGNGATSDSSAAQSPGAATGDGTARNNDAVPDGVALPSGGAPDSAVILGGSALDSAAALGDSATSGGAAAPVGGTMPSCGAALDGGTAPSDGTAPHDTIAQSPGASYTATVEQRNRFFAGDSIEVMLPGGGFFRDTVRRLSDEGGAPMPSAPRAQMTVRVGLSRPVPPYAILRKRASAGTSQALQASPESPVASAE
jgi:collagenase-like PrtC family protease